MFDQIRIVWNITNHCAYNCWFCAAAANRSGRVETAEEKLAILQSILTANRPTEIDFSGGNPWQGAGSVETMLEARRALGREAISISGLGINILEFSDGFLAGLAKEYAFTYDQPWWYKDNRPAYALANRIAITRLQSLGIDCSVILTLRAKGEHWLCDMVEELLKLNPSRIQLLQLMPLGNNQRAFANDEPLADDFTARLRQAGYTGGITKNCAMRGECNGFCDSKLGLDQHGNLYCCIWAADLNVPVAKNPFYLGNLLERPLAEILAEQNERAEHWPRDYCHVLKYLNSRS